MTTEREQKIRKTEIAEMPRKELNAHAFLCEQEQEQYDRELQQLREDRDNLQMLLNNELTHAVTMANQNEMLMEDMLALKERYVQETKLLKEALSQGSK